MLEQQEAFSVETSIRSEEAAAAANVLLLNANGEIDVREGGMTEGKKEGKTFFGEEKFHTRRTWQDRSSAEAAQRKIKKIPSATDFQSKLTDTA